MQIQKITNAQRKFIASLSTARERRKAGLFVAEGERSLTELLPHFRCRCLAATSAWLDGCTDGLRHSIGRSGAEILQAKPDEIQRMSMLKAPQGVMALLEIPAAEPALPRADTLYIMLDRIQDPGNLGTIIRLCDWFGINRIYASPDTVDVYSPKVVQSTMGALARVEVEYTELEPVLDHARKNGIAVYGTFLGGENLYDAKLTPGGIIVMGNEGNGISAQVEKLCSRRLTIPPFPADAATVESLNVSVATAVTVAEFRRRAL